MLAVSEITFYRPILKMQLFPGLWLVGAMSKEQSVSPWFHQAICDQVCRVILSLIGRPTVQYASAATSDLM